jgi:hypothetical protein
MEVSVNEYPVRPPNLQFSYSFAVAHRASTSRRSGYKRNGKTARRDAG